MEEFHQITIQEYLDWKEDLRRRLAEAANNFVGIGYRLKQIRDSKGYEQDGYTSVFDFAAQEFGISTSQASRFMAINDKFSKGGNSLEMPEEYTKLGPSKLSEMLTLPESDYQYITEGTTREQIRELKEFNRHEEEFMNAPEDVQNEGENVQKEPESVSEPEKTDENLQKLSLNGEEPQKPEKSEGILTPGEIIIRCLREYFSKPEKKSAFNKSLIAADSDDIEDFVKRANPTGTAMAKSGRYMLFLRKAGEMNPVKILGGEPINVTWEEIRDAFRAEFGNSGPWEKIFGEKLKPEKPDKQTESKPVKAEESKGNTDTAEPEEPETVEKVTDGEVISKEEIEKNQGFEGKETEPEEPENPDKQTDGQTIKVTKSPSLAYQDFRDELREMSRLVNITGSDLKEDSTPEEIAKAIDDFQKVSVSLLCALQDWKGIAKEREDE